MNEAECRGNDRFEVMTSVGAGSPAATMYLRLRRKSAAFDDVI
jgi:hypothetical protein